MHKDPDYSCVYVQLLTTSTTIGCGLTFTIGRGNEIVKCAVEALKVSKYTNMSIISSIFLYSLLCIF